MKPKPIKLKPKIKALIVQWFKKFRVNEQFLSDDVCNFVLRYLPKRAERESIRRYMRELREDNVINYNIACKSNRIIKVLDIGVEHSR